MIKTFFSKLSDLKNAYRVLEIMDKCGCDIEPIEQEGLPSGTYYGVTPKWYLSKKEAEDLQNIVLFKQSYGKKSKIWNLIFPNIRFECRYLDWEYDKEDANVNKGEN